MFARHLFSLFLGTLQIGASSAMCPTFATNITFPSVTRLPDPFTFLSGDKVKTKDDWKCRRTEITALLQELEFGPLPGRPFMVAASLVGDNLTIQIAVDQKRTTFNASVRLPAGKTTEDGPFPAIIAYRGSDISEVDVATITYDNDQIAFQGDAQYRGFGRFYDVYGHSHSAGSLIAQAWGTSRIIDALEALGPEITGVDPKRIGVVGCAHSGKGVLLAGALDDRIALTIAQETGPGAAVCWRLFSDRSWCPPGKQCLPVEVPSVWDEAPYFRSEFRARFTDKFDELPFDHHELMALHAPRGLLVLEQTDNGQHPEASSYCSEAARTVYAALGVRANFGFNIPSVGIPRCKILDEQRPVVHAFVRRFLLDEKVNTSFWTSVPSDIERWNWTTPQL